MKKQKTIKNQVRQGDVLVMPENSVASNAVAKRPENGRIILAHGEVTGHHHSIESDAADWWKDADSSDTLLDVKTETPLTHQEHGAITIRKGVRRVRRQRQYHSGLVQRVAD